MPKREASGLTSPAKGRLAPTNPFPLSMFQKKKPRPRAARSVTEASINAKRGMDQGTTPRTISNSNPAKTRSPGRCTGLPPTSPADGGKRRAMSLAGPENYLTVWMFQKEEARHRGGAPGFWIQPRGRFRRGGVPRCSTNLHQPNWFRPFEGLF